MQMDCRDWWQWVKNRLSRHKSVLVQQKAITIHNHNTLERHPTHPSRNIHALAKNVLTTIGSTIMLTMEAMGIIISLAIPVMQPELLATSVQRFIVVCLQSRLHKHLLLVTKEIDP
jgi:hypothetical protein